MLSGPWEWILVVLLVLLLFGHKKVPELARALGKSLNEFKKGKSEGAAEEEDADKKADKEV